MSTSQKNDDYVLGYLREDVKEDRRLNSQHDLIKHCILGGRLIHPTIPPFTAQTSIADLGCGTGVWLDDVSNTYFVEKQGIQKQETTSVSPTLMGFDLNAHALNKNPAPHVQLVAHDCTTPFETKYHGKFDLVNIRGLAFAIPEENFSHLVDNAVQLLKPGGYLQWLETDSRLFKAYPSVPEIEDTLAALENERVERKLVTYMPHFMLRKLLSPSSPTSSASQPQSLLPSGDTMTLTNFNLLPAGFSNPSQAHDTVLNEGFSNNLLDGLKLILSGFAMRLKSKNAPAAGTGESDGKQADAMPDETEQSQEATEQGTLGQGDEKELARLQKLIDWIEANSKTRQLKMGGIFPLVVAQKSGGSLG